ncbi:putative nucleic acid-binding protein [Opitutaceae bacterium TAV1]|nr:putative nucleic acid-binding protein [Opitutaceae bacterium TAV1]
MPARSTLVAVDTNLLMDLAVPRDKAHDAVAIFRKRVPGVEFVVVPTVVDELDFISLHGDTEKDRTLANTVMQSLVRVWKFRPLDFIPVGHGTIKNTADKLRGQGLIPEHEINDSYILAEAALANCALLLTSDKHIRGADPTLLSLALRECDVSTILVRTPADIVRQFGGRR